MGKHDKMGTSHMRIASDSGWTLRSFEFCVTKRERSRTPGECLVFGAVKNVMNRGIRECVSGERNVATCSGSTISQSFDREKMRVEQEYIQKAGVRRPAP